MMVIVRIPERTAALLSFLAATPALASVALALLTPAWAWLWLALALVAGLAPLMALAWRWRAALSGRWLLALALLAIPLLPLPLGLVSLVLLRSLLPLRLLWRVQPPAARLLPAGYPWADGALLAAVALALFAI